MVIRGYNKATEWGKRAWKIESKKHLSIKNRTCVFLSHSSIDKPSCRIIAKYLSAAGIDYYLDEEDATLQEADASGNPHVVTERIKEGIRNSSHMLCVVSHKTYRSVWVPFEIGYGHAAIIDFSNKRPTTTPDIRFSILTLSDMGGISIPDYLKIGYLIRNIEDLHKYIELLTGKPKIELINAGRIKDTSAKAQHPLVDIMDMR